MISNKYKRTSSSWTRINRCHGYLEYMYIVGKYQIYFVRGLEADRKASLWRVQINFILADNVRLLCLSMLEIAKQQSNTQVH